MQAFTTEHRGHRPGGIPPVPAEPAARPARIPWPDEAPPPARKPSPWRWLYVPGSFAVALAVADADAPAATRIGEALAVLTGSALVATLFYAWRAATRPAIPATIFILAFFATGGILADKEQGVEDGTQALSRSADLLILGKTYIPQDETPPEGMDARWVWASRKALEDVAGHHQKLAREFQIVPGREPAGWMSARYVADASRYPRVEQYFTAYRAYLAQADSSTLPVFFERLHGRLLEAGFSEERARLMEATTQVGAGVALEAKREELRLALQRADNALAFHALLVRVDPRVRYDGDGDTAVFERDAERERAMALDGIISRLTERLDSLREPARIRTKERQRTRG